MKWENKSREYTVENTSERINCWKNENFCTWKVNHSILVLASNLLQSLELFPYLSRSIIHYQFGPKWVVKVYYRDWTLLIWTLLIQQELYARAAKARGLDFHFRSKYTKYLNSDIWQCKCVNGVGKDTTCLLSVVRSIFVVLLPFTFYNHFCGVS